LNEERAHQGPGALNDAVARLERCGSSAIGELRLGAPLERLHSAATISAQMFWFSVHALSAESNVLCSERCQRRCKPIEMPVLLLR